jgi:hypothetical protein
MATRIGSCAVTATVIGYTVLYVLGRWAGSTARERRARLPGDDMVIRPTIVTDHAATIEAPPEAVWPWLTQMGWHLGGYYTPHWVDRLLFPQNWSSLDHLDPALVRNLAAGDVIPDGEPGSAWFVVAEVDPPHTLVLHSTTHMPGTWRDRFAAAIDWTWTFRLNPLPGQRTRLHLRVRGRTTPWWLTAAYHAAIVPADLVMAVGMLRGIRDRAEAGQPWKSSGRAPLSASAQGDWPGVGTRGRPVTGVTGRPAVLSGLHEPWRKPNGPGLSAPVPRQYRSRGWTSEGP